MCDTFCFFVFLALLKDTAREERCKSRYLQSRVIMSAPTPTIQGYSSSVTSTLRLYDLILKQPADSHLIQQATYYCLL